MKLSQLPVGALVKELNTKYNNDVIIWQVLEHGHTGDPSGSTTLQSRDILTLKCFDAMEPNNSDSSRKSYGNNRYKYSNILQWLNSDKNNWYEAQHTADEAPSNSYVHGGYNEYDAEAGFLTNFSNKFKSALMDVSKVTVKHSVDGGGIETVSGKIHLLSNTEVGLENESGTAEGSIYSYFSQNSGNEGRVAYPTQQAINNSEYTDSNLATNKGWYWWLRTPYASYSHDARRVNTDGSFHIYGSAYYGRFGVRPALCISSDTEVSDTPDASNVYTLQFAPSCVKAYIGDENGEAKLIWSNEPILVPLVPTMTSNTTPSGECVGNTMASGYDLYKAFDGDDSTFCRRTSQTSMSVAYKFDSAVKASKAYYFNGSSNAVTVDIWCGDSNYSTGTVQCSDTVTVPANTGVYIDCNPSNSYLIYRAYVHSSTYQNLDCNTLQFYE